MLGDGQGEIRTARFVIIKIMEGKHLFLKSLVKLIANWAEGILVVLFFITLAGSIVFIKKIKEIGSRGSLATREKVVAWILSLCSPIAFYIIFQSLKATFPEKAKEADQIAACGFLTQLILAIVLWISAILLFSSDSPFK